jgi:hypothetical protein
MRFSVPSELRLAARGSSGSISGPDRFRRSRAAVRATPRAGLRSWNFLNASGLVRCRPAPAPRSRAPARDHGFEHLGFLLGVALHGLDQVGDQVGAALVLVEHLRPLRLGGASSCDGMLLTPHPARACAIYASRPKTAARRASERMEVSRELCVSHPFVAQAARVHANHISGEQPGRIYHALEYGARSNS